MRAKLVLTINIDGFTRAKLVQTITLVDSFTAAYSFVAELPGTCVGGIWEVPSKNN